ncbi:MAG: phosphotransferase [Betaproteobacteria bacterium]|nr:phosphotransferase [Betaproteobacteria bacterium]
MSASEIAGLLGEIDTDPAGSAARTKLAKSLDFDRYFSIARIYDLDHGFWSGLLSDKPADRGLALVLETRLGAVSASLAKRFDRIISWHASDAAAALSQRWFEANGLSNISTVVGMNLADLDSYDGDLTAVFLVGPGADPMAQWGQSGEAAVDLLLHIARAHLVADGQLIIVDNNQWAYKKLMEKETGRGVALPLLRRRLQKMSFQTEIFVCGAPLTTSHSPPPDLFRQSSVAKGSNLPKNWLSALKASLLNQPLFRLFWPSFVVIASKKSQTSFLDRLLTRHAFGKALGWHADEKIGIKRLVAGNSGTAIVIAGPDARDSADIVIRLPSSSHGEELCRVNARALAALADTPWARLVPRLVDAGSFAGRSYFAETRCAGFEVYSGTNGLAQMVVNACEAMSDLQRSIATQATMTSDMFARHVAPLVDDVARFCTPDVRERLAKIKDALHAKMLGGTTSIGIIHGDFKLGNILFNQSGELTALIDWDGFSKDSFQLFDFLTLLAYKIAYDQIITLPKVYVAHLLPWRLPSGYNELMGPAIKDLVRDDESFLCVRIVFWFALLRARFDSVYKYHESWHEEYMAPVLVAIELALKEPAG